MIRQLNIYVNPESGTITRQEGDGFFFLGDNNKIIIIPEIDVAKISISGNIPGIGSYISELQKKEDGSFVLEGNNMNGFLQKIGKINCNIHISNENNERITTLPFQVENKISFDKEGTIISPTSAHTLEEIYTLLEELNNGEFPGGTGQDGEDGFSPKITAFPIEGGYTLVITNKDEPDDIITIWNGQDGKDGEKGEKGEKGDTGEAGKDGKDGVTPVRGEDYWTPEDVQIMKNECHIYIESLILGGMS